MDKLKQEQERVELENLRSGMPGKIRHVTGKRVVWSTDRDDEAAYYQAQQQVILDKRS